MSDMQAKDLFFRVPATEDLDWGGARTRRVLLRNKRCELAFSVFSVSVDEWLTQNRDYSYEGLSAYDGENWKYLDALLIAAPMRLKQVCVDIWPWRARYLYECEKSDKEVVLDWSLLSDEAGAQLIIEGIDEQLRVAALVDIRHMYGESAPREHFVHALPNGLQAARAGKSIAITSTQTISVFLKTSLQPWRYKLGIGNRCMTTKGIAFEAEERQLLRISELLLKPINGRCEIRLLCHGLGSLASLHEREAPFAPFAPFAPLLTQIGSDAVERAQGLLSALKAPLATASRLWGAERAKALAARTVTLLHNFELAVNGVVLPDAGAFWFRNLWLRDALEAMLINWSLFSRLEPKKTVALLRFALSNARKGLVLNKLPERIGEKPSYAIDATLLSLLLGSRVAAHSQQLGLSDQQASALRVSCNALFANFLASAQSSNLFSLEHGLLATPAQASWTDAIVKGRPTRLPRDLAPSERFFLLELNALWLTMLKAYADQPIAAELLSDTSPSFKRVFLRNNALAHIATSAGATRERSALELEALYWAHEHFTDDEVRRIINGLRRLFVYRKGKLFGVLLREGGEPFFNDAQYHGCVIWLKSSPHLYAALMRINEGEAAEQLLLSVLEHQCEEGAIHYSSEVFSQPIGVNPSPGPLANEPVPVRNPAQLFSQWTAPFYDYLTLRLKMQKV